MTKRNNKKTQKLWRMKGCSSKSKRKSLAVRCKICPKSCRCGPNCKCSHTCPGNCYMKGLKGGCNCGFPWFKSKKSKKQQGGCGSCSVPMQSGGGINSPSGPSLVGAPYNPSSLGGANHYSLNKYTPFDPQTEGVVLERGYRGGKKSKSRKNKKIKGGGLIPQDLINIRANINYGLGSAYNSLLGYSQPVSPLPYKGHFHMK